MNVSYSSGGQVQRGSPQAEIKASALGEVSFLPQPLQAGRVPPRPLSLIFTPASALSFAWPALTLAPLLPPSSDGENLVFGLCVSR